MSITAKSPRKPATLPEPQSDEMKTISGEVPLFVYNEIADEAKENDRTVAAQLRVILKQYVATKS